MTPEAREKLIANLFHKVVNCGEAERKAYLDEACRNLPDDIRAEVESLLKADQGANDSSEGFLQAGPINLARMRGWVFDETKGRGTSSDSKTRSIRGASFATPGCGQVIDDRFVLEEPLGQGGMGIVYRARDRRLRRTVALKFLSPEAAGDEKASPRFLREAQAAAALNHANICTIYDVCQAEGHTSIAMEYVEGQTLKQILAQQSMLVADAIGYALQTAEGLQAAHEAGIVHRDIKPANLMVNRRGRIKILDFGLAQLGGVSHVTQTGAAVGTVAYMSPEQLRGEVADHRSDQWSLGVVLYELLTGRRPFQRDDLAAIIRSILDDAPESVRTWRADVPEALDALVLRMLQKQPDRRYPRTSDLCSALAERVEELSQPTGLYSAPSRASSDAAHAVFPTQPVAAAADGGSLWGGGSTLQKRHVTVLYCRLATTPNDAGLDPELVFELLRPYQQACDSLAQRFGGHRAPYHGNGLLVYFGYPHAQEDGPFRAVRAGLGMVEAVQRLSREARSEQTMVVHAAVGIHSGMVVAQDNRRGSGSDSLQLFGKVPDVATRLSGRSDANSVVISDATYRLVKETFSCREIGQDQAAGSVPLYQVLAERVSASHHDAVVRRAVPLVGRDHELNLLLARWDGARSDMGHIVLLSGEAGMGKTRLVRELKQRVADDRRSRLVECCCSAYRENHAFHPFIDWLDQLVRQSESDEVTSDRRARLQDYLTRRGFSEDEVAPLLVPLLPLLADRPVAPTGLSPDQRKEKTQRALLAILLPRSLAEPVLLVVEDLHWADPSTLELLALLNDQVASANILVVLTFRSEFQPTWPLRSHMTQLNATRLPPSDVERLIDLIAQGSELSDRLRQQLVERADGVPLFVEDLTTMVIESQRSRARKNRGARVESETGPTIPATLRDSLMARLDRLGSAKQVAQLAAAIGREFTYELLHAVSTWNESRLQNELARLARAELLLQRGFPPQATYWFRHTLIQETAYQSLLQRQRQSCHRQIAAALQTHFPEIATMQPDLIAHHLIEAGDERHAVDFLLAAGDSARALYANHEAEQNYAQAVRILKEHGQAERASKTLMKMALVFTAAFQPDQAQAAYKEAFALQPTPQPREPPTRSKRSGEVLRYAAGDPLGLDPGKTYDTDSAFLQSQLFEGLVVLGPDQDVLPAVASHWEMSLDGTMYTFHLRSDVRWSDGEQLIAEDFEYAWKRNLQPETDSPGAHLLSPLRNALALRAGDIDNPDRVGVKAVGALRLEVRLENPTAYLLHLLAHPIAYPLPQRCIDVHPNDWATAENIVTNGPYSLAEWTKGKRLVLEANWRYRGPFPGNAKRVECPVFTRHSQALEAYAQDRLDVTELAAANAAAMTHARQTYGKELVFSPMLSTTYLVLPVTWAPICDVRVRRALAHAVDRHALTRAVSQGEHQAATGGIVPPGMPGHAPGLGVPFDPASARRLLAEAGYPDGRGMPTIPLLHTHGLSGDSFIPLLCRAWRDNLGVDVQVTWLDWQEFQQRMKDDPSHMMLSCWIADYPDPDSFLRVAFHSQQGSNEPRWHNRRFDELVQQAAQVTQTDRRIGLYHEADRILVADQVAILPLTYGQMPLLVKPWVAQFPPGASYLRHLKDVVIERDRQPQR